MGMCYWCGEQTDPDTERQTSVGTVCPNCWSRCSVEGCSREGIQKCEMCGEIVCGPHSRTNVAAEMILCFSCDIGLSEGLGAAMRGW